MIKMPSITKSFYRFFVLLAFLVVTAGCKESGSRLTDHVNPFLGTATLWEPEDHGYVLNTQDRAWGAEVFPGSSLPNALVPFSPVTQSRRGAHYHYQDPVTYGF